jgi:transposase
MKMGLMNRKTPVMINVCYRSHKNHKNRGDSQMRNRTNERLEAITPGSLIIGIDVAKEEQWARMVDYRGVEKGKAFLFKNNRQGFESIVARIREISNLKEHTFPIEKVIVGMEPTGHYWKALAHYLMTETDFMVVCVNPYHTKKAKELDDNSPVKSDKKDAITIARLVKDGRYFDPYLPEDIYAELRGLSNYRVTQIKRSNAIKNNITAILDEYFPEIVTVFKDPIKSKTCRQIFKSCPFPSDILEMSEEDILAEIRKAVKRSVGIMKVRELIGAAETSIGVDYGLKAAKMRICGLIEELELIEKGINEIEQAMEEELYNTGYAEIVLGIKGVGVVSAASFFGEIGDPLRFGNARQIHNYAGYNLVEDSSGKSKSGTCISKRGRKQLRSLLYLMAFTMVGCNDEMKELYRYLTTRQHNPLKKKQALVVISKRIITVIYSMVKKNEAYNPDIVFGLEIKDMMKAA